MNNVQSIVRHIAAVDRALTYRRAQVLVKVLELPFNIQALRLSSVVENVQTETQLLDLLPPASF